ncbi:MAG: hypothetical protein EBQ96_01485 [Proteobacteria bacterium]|nr:hypothetical protein [Pseudomonadota bacterium]
MRVEWHIFREDGQVVEAQIWEPDTPSRKLVLFCPGFPGRGGTMFEQRHAAAFVEHGHTVCVIKHAGTRFDGADAPFMINNGARLMKARKEGHSHVGGGPSTISAWLNEPLIALKKLEKNFSHIDVIGNSFGALSALQMVLDERAPVDNIKSLLLLAGAQGVDEDPFNGIMRLWTPVTLSLPVIWEKIELDNAVSICSVLKDTYAQIAARGRDMPKHINLSYLVVENDEILRLSDTEDFKHKIMGGRGHILLDKDSCAYPSFGLMAHDTPDLTTEKLMEILH